MIGGCRELILGWGNNFIGGVWDYWGKWYTCGRIKFYQLLEGDFEIWFERLIGFFLVR